MRFGKIFGGNAAPSKSWSEIQGDIEQLDRSVDNETHPALDGLDVLFRSLAALVPSIVIPLLVGWIAVDSQGNSSLTTFQQFETGCFVFFVITLAMIANTQISLAKNSRAEVAKFRVETEFDRAIVNIRTSFQSVLTRGEMKENLYARYFLRVMEEVEQKFHQAASDKTLGVEEFTYAMTDILVEIIAARNRDTIRLVHFSKAGAEILSSSWGRRYYDYLTTMACKGDVKIRRLIIHDRDSELSDDEKELLERLKIFHQANKNHEYRELAVDEWNGILTEMKIREKGDMGIWGDLYVYRTQSFAPYDIQGTWTTDDRSIRDMTSAFDHAWDFAPVPEPIERAHAMCTHELFTGCEPPDHLTDIEMSKVEFGK